MNETISIIISTKNRPEDIIRCLESITIQTVLPDEVVIVDSSDTEGLKSKLDSFDVFNIKYIHAEASLTRARNIGIDNSMGDIIIFLDDDVILNKNHIKEIMHVFDIYPAKKIGGVTGEEVVTGEVQTSIIIRFRRFYDRAFATIFFLLIHGDGRFRLSGFPTVVKSGSVDKITKVEFLYGFNMAFRRKIISEFMFDENFHGYSWGEDDDIAYRISRKYQNFYTPFAKVVHNASPSARGDKYAVMKMIIENQYYLFKKNLPQDFMHKFAFWWSVVGLFVRAMPRVVRKGDSSEVRGLVSGIKEILNKRGR